MLCNVVQFVLSLLVVTLPITVFTSQPVAAGVLAAPMVPLTLLLNEHKWIIDSSRANSDVPVITERGGSKVFLVTVLILIPIAMFVLFQEVANARRSPLYVKFFQADYEYLSYVGIGTLGVGWIASALLF